MRKQTGTIVQRCGRWYLRYWDRENKNGSLVRKRVSRFLGVVATRGSRPPADITQAAEDFMHTVNTSKIPPEQNMSIDAFFESVYLPWIKTNRRPDTYKNSRDVWNHHVRALASSERVTLKNVRTFTVQGWLDQIGRSDLSRSSLKRIKSTLSGGFRQAKQLGYFDGVNPV